MVAVAIVVQLIPIFLAYLVPLDVDVVLIKFHQFLFCEEPVMIIFVFYHFFCILVVSMATATILKKTNRRRT
jgi:predicted membrane protein